MEFILGMQEWFTIRNHVGAWMDQMKHLSSAQVNGPRVLGSSPMSSSLLCGESPSPSTALPASTLSVR